MTIRAIYDTHTSYYSVEFYHYDWQGQLHCARRTVRPAASRLARTGDYLNIVGETELRAQYDKFERYYEVRFVGESGELLAAPQFVRYGAAANVPSVLHRSNEYSYLTVEFLVPTAVAHRTRSDASRAFRIAAARVHGYLFGNDPIR